MTPRELFAEEHAALVEKGEKWMKETAAGCMVVAALIATVVFAAAFTLPGGNKEYSGHIWLKSLHSENTYDATELSLSLVVIENDWISPPSGYDKISGNAYVVPICRDIDGGGASVCLQ
ncbi:Ankyrin repeat family protein [Thalictrum thalictroides]|uniref:Ankyrin repeat family protein n=1 Tax=Thalictrum thalictroides TaxID=46969 RepID=A0A7J6VPU3_THATH|nr:Ankyrin repeat family protein [Thalictrum thalictroides]